MKEDFYSTPSEPTTSSSTSTPASSTEQTPEEFEIVDAADGLKDMEEANLALSQKQKETSTETTESALELSQYTTQNKSVLTGSRKSSTDGGIPVARLGAAAVDKTSSEVSSTSTASNMFTSKIRKMFKTVEMREQTSSDHTPSGVTRSLEVASSTSASKPQKEELTQSDGAIVRPGGWTEGRVRAKSNADQTRGGSSYWPDFLSFGKGEKKEEREKREENLRREEREKKGQAGRGRSQSDGLNPLYRYTYD